MASPQRFLRHLTQTAAIQRSPTSSTAGGDMAIGEPEEVVASVQCLLDAVKVSQDMVAMNPGEAPVYRLLLPAGTDIEDHDQAVVDGTTYTVAGPPVEHTVRGAAHHIEAIVEPVIE